MSDEKPRKFDPRAFVAVDVGMPENLKVIGLSDAAFRVFVESICYCGRNKTDGLMLGAAVRRTWADEAVAELVRAGLFEVAGDDFQLHDYLKHNRTKEEIEELHDTKSDNGQRGAHARWHIARRRYDKTCEFCIAQGLVAPSA